MQNEPIIQIGVSVAQAFLEVLDGKPVTQVIPNGRDVRGLANQLEHIIANAIQASQEKPKAAEAKPAPKAKA